MSAEERTSAGEKRYENGIKAMSDEERVIKWEQQYAKFEQSVGMPGRRTKLDNWQICQLSYGSDGLDDKIQKEIAENEEGTVWSDRKARLLDCIEQKNKAMRNNKYEQQYAKFEGCAGMPAVGTVLHNWQKNKLKQAKGLDAKIERVR